MNPYKALEESAFWALAVAQRSMFDVSWLWRPKWQISRADQIVTFGSCFAQHIGRALRSRGYAWTDFEPAPPKFSGAACKRFNYGLFSARTGNIYTVSLLRQWVMWALGDSQVPEETWSSDGRFYDPFRPAIEPDGFESVEELLLLRAATLDAFRAAAIQCDVFVFTLGLTESWHNIRSGHEYPMCPGTVAGEFDPGVHQFVNHRFGDILSDLAWTIERLRAVNPRIRFLLTVSPVPLTATMSGQHVLVATQHSKSILRSVAGQLAQDNDFVDYFPSYEIINAPPFRGTFFEPNLRSVNPFGVDFVMKQFFNALPDGAREALPAEAAVAESSADERAARRARRQARRQMNQQAGGARQAPDAEGVVCEEELLAAFGTGS